VAGAVVVEVAVEDISHLEARLLEGVGLIRRRSGHQSLLATNNDLLTCRRRRLSYGGERSCRHNGKC